MGISTVATEQGFTGNTFITEVVSGARMAVGVYFPGTGSVSIYSSFKELDAADPRWLLVDTMTVSGIYVMEAPLHWAKVVITANSSATLPISVWFTGEGG
jgi:hypothetical protein